MSALPLLFLGALGALFPPGAGGSFSHSLHYFCTSVSEPGEGSPRFNAVGYLDNQVICRYDSNCRRPSALAPWMEKAEAQYWNTETQFMQSKEEEVKEHLITLMNVYNQSEGFHTLQLMYGCELREDGSKGGFYRYAYDGRDFISLDKETLTWVAIDVQSTILKSKWDSTPLTADFTKAYLEDICIEWLKKNLYYGKETLLRTEPPVGKVTRQAIGDGQEALICQAHGFYPREIDATWRKGKEILEHETFRRNIAPNSDGTYHTWLSIEIDPKERDLYQCHVDHASLPKPLVLAFKEPLKANRTFIMAANFGVLATAVLVIVFVFMKKRHTKLEEQPKICQHPDDSIIPRVNSWDSDSSTTPLNPKDVKDPTSVIGLK